MTQYADYEYYTDNFGGELYTQSITFNRAAIKASRLIKQATHGLIDEENLADMGYCVPIKDCTCALAERILELKNEDEAGRVASESVGPHSVSYRSEARKTTKELDREYYHVIEEYLAETGLLSCGLRNWYRAMIRGDGE